jgi:hypothetical protein
MNISKFRNYILLFLSITWINSFSQSNQNKKPTTQNTTQYSVNHALECIEDYYEFYNADEFYSDPKVRRVSNNVFYVSLKYCTGGKNICYKQVNIGTWDAPLYIDEKNEFFWHSKVLVLTCTSKTKYKVTVKY